MGRNTRGRARPLLVPRAGLALPPRCSGLVPRPSRLRLPLRLDGKVGRPRLGGFRNLPPPAGAGLPQSAPPCFSYLHALVPALPPSWFGSLWSWFGRVGLSCPSGALPLSGSCGGLSAAPWGTPLRGSRFARHIGACGAFSRLPPCFASPAGVCFPCAAACAGLPAPSGGRSDAAGSVFDTRGAREMGGGTPRPPAPLGRRHGRGDFLGGLIAAPHVPPASVFHGHFAPLAQFPELNYPK